MTTDSHKKLEQQVIQALDAQNANMPDKTLRDISKIRQAALATRYQSKTYWNRRPVLYSAGFTAAALLAVMLWPQWQTHSLPAITAMPMMTHGDVPTEDINLLEDLEFATWLAANENQLLL